MVSGSEPSSGITASDILARTPTTAESPSELIPTKSRSRIIGSAIVFHISNSIMALVNAIPSKPCGIPSIFCPDGGKSSIIVASKDSKKRSETSTSILILPNSLPSKGINVCCACKTAEISTVISVSALSSPAGLANVYSSISNVSE